MRETVAFMYNIRREVKKLGDRFYIMITLLHYYTIHFFKVRLKI